MRQIGSDDKCVDCGEYHEKCRCWPAHPAKPSDRQVGGSHYKDLAIQPSHYIVKNGIGWYVGNAIKYLSRYKTKGGRIDLEKAKHYIDLEIQDTYGSADSQELP